MSEKEFEIGLGKGKEKRAEKCFLEEKYKAAFKYFCEAISLNPECVSYYEKCCECYVAMGSCLSSAKKESSGIDGESVQGYIQVGKCFRALGKLEEALAAFEKAKELDTRNEDVVKEIVTSLQLRKHLRDGDEALKQKRYAAASEHFNSASEIAVWDTLVLLKRAEIIFHLPRVELHDLASSVSEQLKESSNIICMKAIVAYNEGMKPEALENLKKSLDADPSNKKAEEWRSRIQAVCDHEEKGNKAVSKRNFAEALELYRGALSHEPGSSIVQSKLHFNIGLVEMKQTNFNAAIESLSRAINFNEDYIKALEKRAECYRQTKKYEKAVGDYQKLYSLTSSDAHLRSLREAQKQLRSNASKEYYDALGVSSNASMEDIRKSYKRLALKFHPDRMQSEEDKAVGEQRFKELSQAYSVLSDPLKRERYDRGETEDTIAAPSCFSTF